MKITEPEKTKCKRCEADKAWNKAWNKADRAWDKAWNKADRARNKAWNKAYKANKAWELKHSDDCPKRVKP